MFDVVKHLMHGHEYRPHGNISELSELYISMTLKMLGLSLIGIFIPIFLFDKGYSLIVIASFYIIVYTFRLYSDIFSAKMTARYGPKHVLTLSYLVLLLTLAMLVTTESIKWPIPVLAVLFGLYLSFFHIPFNFDLSSVKKKEKEGKEISYIIILQKLASAIGPLLGGLVAWLFSIEAAIYTAMVLILMAALPLFATADKVKAEKNVKISIKEMFAYKGDSTPFIAFGIESQVVLFIWPLFIATTVFTDQIYASVGFIVATGLLISILTSYLIGKYVDKHGGAKPMNITANILTFLNVLRPLVTTPFGALGMSMVSEPTSSGFTISFVKGFWSNADLHGERRLTYITSMILFMHVGRIILWTTVLVLLLIIEGSLALQVSFLIGALAMQLVRFHNFVAYK